jgi:hypothetical protein
MLWNLRDTKRCMYGTTSGHTASATGQASRAQSNIKPRLDLGIQRGTFSSSYHLSRRKELVNLACVNIGLYAFRRMGAVCLLKLVHDDAA